MPATTRCNLAMTGWPSTTGKGPGGKDAPTTRRRTLSRRAWLALPLAAVALLLGAGPAWLHAKAALAQVLLQRAWAEGDGGRTSVRPWPWADTHPVARLRVAEHGIDQIVLAGDSGRTLAFGPGWAEASSAPGSQGTVVISAHRDTHFAFLRGVAPGTTVALEAGDGERAYRVVGTEVVDSRVTRIDTGGGDRLLLVTCWPFDALDAGGPMRYVVTAIPDPAATHPL